MSGFCASKKLFVTLSWSASLAQVRSSIGAHRLTLPNPCPSSGCSSLYYIRTQDKRCFFSQRVWAGKNRRKKRGLCSNSLIAPRRLLGCCEIFSSEISVLELCQVLFSRPQPYGVTPVSLELISGGKRDPRLKEYLRKKRSGGHFDPILVY